MFSKVFQELLVIPKFSDLFWEHFEKCLEKIQDCSETFLVVLAACGDCSVFQNVPKYLVSLETFQSVLEYFKISFENFSKI